MRSIGQSVRSRVPRAAAACLAALLALAASNQSSPGADIAEVRKKLITGQYQEVIHEAEKAIGSEESDEEWRLLLIQAQLITGRYTNALDVLNKNLTRWPMSSSIRLRLLGREVFLYNGQAERAKEMLQEINNLAGSRGSYAYRDVPNLVALARTVLLLGADPKLVLDKLLEPAKRAASPTPRTVAPFQPPPSVSAPTPQTMENANPDPGLREIYLAIGELALSKNDFELAGKVFQDAQKVFPEDPDILFGVAKSFSSGERARMLQSLEQALEQNTNHCPSLLLLADHLVDAEEYREADKLLDRVLAVNPSQPQAWAYRAVLAHLRNAPADERKSRDKALAFWTNNPAVDHLIGRKLSQKYRFAEGASAQRQALRFDPDFLPARSQLATDLLRLGQEDEGWMLADEAYKADGYDVTAFNLVTLKDAMAKFQTITNEHFILRMGAKEAPVYGARALALLERARARLSEKYGMELAQPTIVEIFPEQKDFAVRTFGMPGGAGYLGVCFGSVVTANSPASQVSHAVNWEAVLWHEFCHVITLAPTKNKMPRWLSEGISVYEERQA
ncbi:MAG: tetratricopeptide repeat protein, partial [Verrucomicrobia bacterium]|nr:tetratricopeptide repeat protein [Verrucomicrobiota bacterium]